MKRIVNCFLIAAVLVTLFACGKEDNGKKYAKQYVYPPDGTDWAMVAPEKHNFDSDLLEKARDYMATTHVTAAMFIVGGECILQYGPIASDFTYMASCRKSVLAMLYGKYIENGTVNPRLTMEDLGITDVVEKGKTANGVSLEDYPDGLTPQEKTATIQHLITARSGVYHDASNDGSSAGTIVRDTYKPGEHYLYNNWDFNVAGFVLEKLVKGKESPLDRNNKAFYQILQADLAQPIGMADWDIGRQKFAGNNSLSIYPAYHIYITTRDMCRIAYLMLRKGKWNGKQVISESWVKEITSPQSTLQEVGPDGYFSYGYMWWLFDKHSKYFTGVYDGAYMACGSHGQYMLVLPKLDLVAAWKTRTTRVEGDKTVENSTNRTNFLKTLDFVIKAYKGEIQYKESSGDDIIDDDAENDYI